MSKKIIEERYIRMGLWIVEMGFRLYLIKNGKNIKRYGTLKILVILSKMQSL